jgi:hypothetical protein
MNNSIYLMSFMWLLLVIMLATLLLLPNTMVDNGAAWLLLGGIIFILANKFNSKDYGQEGLILLAGGVAVMAAIMVCDANFKIH